MGPTGWAEPWNRLGDWQASSESSRASKSSNRMLLFYTNLRAPTERTPPRAIASKPRSPLHPGGSSFKMTRDRHQSDGTHTTAYAAPTIATRHSHVSLRGNALRRNQIELNRKIFSAEANQSGAWLYRPDQTTTTRNARHWLGSRPDTAAMRNAWAASRVSGRRKADTFSSSVTFIVPYLKAQNGRGSCVTESYPRTEGRPWEGSVAQGDMGHGGTDGGLSDTRHRLADAARYGRRSRPPMVGYLSYGSPESD